MIFPDRIKIGGHDIKIVFIDVLDEETQGIFDSCKNTIFIDEKLSDSQKQVTLIHEIIHACNGELDEVILDSLAQQLYQVLAENDLDFRNERA